MEIEGKTGRVLVVDDDECVRELFSNMLRAAGYEVEVAADGREALDKLATFSADAILTDVMMPRMDGFELLRHLKADGRAQRAIVMTAHGSLNAALRTVHECGAFWFLEKPVGKEALCLLLDRVVTRTHLQDETQVLKRELRYKGVLGEMVGNSRTMLEVFAFIQQVAPSSAPIIIAGESGTGKELAARAIHAMSPRRTGPFISLDCTAMPDTLLESELFGHEKNSYIGAIAQHRGCFETASSGTLFLNEISTVPLPTQGRVVRVLDEGRARRIGGKVDISVDVRVIASTSSRLEDAMAAGKFREDLFYRLNVFTIFLPPLRERKEDLPVLAETLLENLNRKHQTKVTELSSAVLARFEAYSWPGNVRELRNVLERALILTGEGIVDVGQLGGPFADSARRVSVAPGGLKIPMGSTIEQAERGLIEMTLENTRHDSRRAAEILGISRITLSNKLREYGGLEEMLKTHNKDLKEIALAAMSSRSASIVVGGDVTAKKDHSVNVGGNMQIENSGILSVSGDVNYAVQSLEQSKDGDDRRLAELLSELEKRLGNHPTLTQEDKSLASEKVSEIAAAATKPGDGLLRKTGRSALLALKGLADGLPDVVKIVDAIGKILHAKSELGI